MRTMIRVKMPVEAGNKAVQDGSLQKTITEALQRLKPEAAYFFAEHGVRAAIMIVEMKEPSEIPAIAEPFFTRLNASVEFIPIMNAEDLKLGLAKFGQKG